MNRRNFPILNWPWIEINHGQSGLLLLAAVLRLAYPPWILIPFLALIPSALFTCAWFSLHRSVFFNVVDYRKQNGYNMTTAN